MAPVRLVGALLALLTLALFAQVRSFEFVNYDDPEYVTENYHVAQGLTANAVVWAFRTFHFSNWHPLTWLSHMLDCELFGLDAGAHHLVSVLFHVLNVVLLYALLVRLTGAPWAAAFVAALFAWHPLRVESVAWIAERKDVLCATFGLLSLHAYTAYAREPKAGRMALVTVLFALGLMAKPMLVTLPFVMLLLDVWPLGRLKLGREDGRVSSGIPAPAGLRASDRPKPGQPPAGSWRGCVLEKWPLYLLTLLSCGITFAAQRTDAMRTVEEVPWGLRLGNALLSYATYIVKTFWPVDLAVFYPLRDAVPLAGVAGALLLLATVSWLAWRQRGRRPWLLVGWCWFVGMLVPVIGLVAVGAHAMADRYMYLPQIGLFLVLAWAVEDFVRAGRLPGRLAAGGAALALAGCAVLTSFQLRHWRDSETLFRRALAVVPDNTMAYINLGTAQESQARHAEALTNYLAALRLEPNRAAIHNNLGNALDALGRNEEAVAHYREALRLQPGATLVLKNLGTSLAAQGRFDEAMTNYAEALRLDPDDPQTFHLIGLANLRQGRTRAAIEALRGALRWNPSHARALHYLARVLATDEDAALRDGPEAVHLAMRAVKATDGVQPQALDTLGMALAEAGRFDEAVIVARQAADLLDSIDQKAAAEEVRARVALYQARQPFREKRHGR